MQARGEGLKLIKHAQNFEPRLESVVVLKHTINSGLTHLWIKTANKCININPFLPGKSVKGEVGNSADPDQTPHHVASDQGLHCLLTKVLIKIKIKETK